MNHGLTILNMKLPIHYTADYLTQIIIDLCGRNNIPGVTIVLGNGNLFTTDDPEAILDAGVQ
jgi:hypothetical protein